MMTKQEVAEKVEEIKQKFYDLCSKDGGWLLAAKIGFHNFWIVQTKALPEEDKAIVRAALEEIRDEEVTAVPMVTLFLQLISFGDLKGAYELLPGAYGCVMTSYEAWLDNDFTRRLLHVLYPVEIETTSGRGRCSYSMSITEVIIKTMKDLGYAQESIDYINDHNAFMTCV